MPGSTAARCLFNKTGFSPPSHILFGGVDISSLDNFPEKIPVLQAFYPNQYKPDIAESNYDVAILKLARPTTAIAVTLSTSAPAPGTVLTSIGWGSTQLVNVGVKNNLLR